MFERLFDWNTNNWNKNMHQHALYFQEVLVVINFEIIFPEREKYQLV